jgi:hypothetical protein
MSRRGEKSPTETIAGALARMGRILRSCVRIYVCGHPRTKRDGTDLVRVVCTECGHAWTEVST